ncbi:hypothetical protein MTR_1g015780 [Medicago truncatula]|uniref:Uncharacterized protein n=1 Tax=Medicago truncatula TaxID=3880 RepID=G7I9V2_MEDTR|nr:hypothetical protein MTR_1g015780 [Medicago truncatula]
MFKALTKILPPGFLKYKYSSSFEVVKCEDQLKSSIGSSRKQKLQWCGKIKQ